jgi:hypothetical protein
LVTLLLYAVSAGADAPLSPQSYDALEREIQAVLADKSESPRDKGRVFLALAQMYGPGSRKDLPKIEQYAEQALQYPLAASETVQLHRTCGAAANWVAGGAQSGDAQIRRLAGRHYLQAYAALMAGLADPVPENVRQDFHRVKLRPQRPTTQQQADFDKGVEKRLALMDKAEEEDHLRGFDRLIVAEIVMCFNKFPDGAAELREAAKGVIDDPVVVNQLVDTLKAASTQPAVATRGILPHN